MDGRAGGQTDGQMDRFAISISRVSMLTRDKNHITGCAVAPERRPAKSMGDGEF